MRIHLTAPDAGEMLQRIDHAALRIAIGRRCDEVRHDLRIVAVGAPFARADIRHWREIHIDAEPLQLRRGTGSPAPGRLRLAHETDLVLRRRRRYDAAGAHDLPALLIDADEQRCRLPALALRRIL